jgi:hypothetical protein
VIFLTEIEIRQLHQWFSHLAVNCLYKLLKQAGYNNINHHNLIEIKKFCHYCQMNRQAPQRFKFTLTDDQEFNYKIIIDIMYLDSKPVLHIID